MYSQKRISENLSKISRQTGFKFIEHSIKDVRTFVDGLNNLINLDLYKETCGKGGDKTKIEFKSKRAEKEFNSPAIQSFIFNEITLCTWNFHYWAERYYQIINTDGLLINYKPNLPQRINDKILSRLEEKRIAIRKLTIKGRQIGETIYSRGKIQHRIQFHKVTALNASYRDEDTYKMVKPLTDSLDRQPFWLRPKLTKLEAGNFYQYEDSFLDLGYGTQHSLGRGGTYQVLHASELAKFKYPREAIDDAILNAMHESKWILQLLEGTAEGRDNWLHEKVRETIRAMSKGSTSLVFTFFPYWIRRDIYPTEGWIRARNEYFSSWSPKEETIHHAIKARNYVLSTPDLKDELGSNWRMDREQMFHYEVEREAAEEADRLETFLQEKPADLEEAFQHSGKGVYSVQITSKLNDRAQQEIPEVFKLRGDSSEIDPKLFPFPDEILDGGKTIPINCRWSSSEPNSSYELVQIKFNGWNDDFDNKILIWEHPNKYFKYGIGYDPSEGYGRNISDEAVLEIIRAGTVVNKDKQVCEFSSPELPQLRFWPYILALSTYFSPKQEQSLLTIEINKGFEAQNQLLKRGYTNLFRQIDLANLTEDGRISKHFGLFTSPRTRRSLMDHLYSFIKGDWIELNSVLLISEIKDLYKKITVNNREGKVLGKKDNRYLALGICLYGLHQAEILGLQKASWEERKRKEDSTFELKSMPKDYLSSDEMPRGFDIEYLEDDAGLLMEY